MSLLRRWWKLTPEEIPAKTAPAEGEEAVMEDFARAVVRFGLETPAVMFLEMNRPISFLASQGMFFCAPLLGMLLPPRKIDTFARLLDTPGGVERLIQRIEEVATHNSQLSTDNSK